VRDSDRPRVAPKRRAIGTPVKAPTRRRRSTGSTGSRGPSRARAPRRGGADRGRSRGGADPAARARVESAANMALIFGILSIAVIALVGPIAIIKGNEATRLARRARISVPGTATAGLVMGWIATVLMILVFGMFLLLFVGVLGAASLG